MLTYLFALVIGLALGMLGGGGSILTVPVFTYIAGLEPKVAIASSLPVVAIVSAFGALGHWRAGHVQLRTALLFGAFTMVGGFTGARTAQFISGAVQMLLFSVVMLLAALSMLLRGPGRTEEDGHTPTVLPLGKLAPLGMAVGMLTGIVGVGGGFMIVPALVQIGRVPMRAAIGTSLLVIAMNATSSTVGYLGQVELPLRLLAPFTLIAFAGIAMGTSAAKRVPQATLRRAFALLLLVVGAFVLYQNFHIVTGRSDQAATASRPDATASLTGPATQRAEAQDVLQTVL